MKMNYKVNGIVLHALNMIKICYFITIKPTSIHPYTMQIHVQISPCKVINFTLGGKFHSNMERDPWATK